MRRWWEALSDPPVTLGDFNVAPLECDVWSHKALLTVVSHTPVEVETLTRLRDTPEWITEATFAHSRAHFHHHPAQRVPHGQRDRGRPSTRHHNARLLRGGRRRTDDGSR